VTDRIRDEDGMTTSTTAVRRTPRRSVARGHPGWTYRELAGVGHVPQLQVPELFVTEVQGWLDALPPASAAG
jgi:hypothetical protein